ncbi:hypothetical protein [Lutibacter flavus]|uniref:Uncharacterized protein n=1 Tax=Lutibacter flavus TaxID=691689 RepID=A0A238YTZ1_9FLAO|nr:hypothetical protein [Lutibacter flavus]SNR74053.1 hypothetical protein SAMN04488111_2784 [Lutibacter flavus]
MKTKIINLGFILILLLSCNIVFSQVGIGTTSPETSAMLDVDVSSLPSDGKKGFLPPRMTTTERDGIIVTPATGLLIYNTTTNQLNYFNGTVWTVVDTSSGSFVDLSTPQAVGGNKNFTGTITASGRLMIPMGEISYFNTTTAGFQVNIPSKSTGNALGTDSMVKINPPSGTVFVNDMFGLTASDGANSRLTYQGAVGRYFHIALSFSYRPNLDEDVFVFGVLKNDFSTSISKVEDSSKLLITTGKKADYNSTAMHVLLWLDPLDSIEFYVGNVTAARDVFIKSFNFVAIGM